MTPEEAFQKALGASKKYTDDASISGGVTDAHITSVVSKDFVSKNSIVSSTDENSTNDEVIGAKLYHDYVTSKNMNTYVLDKVDGSVLGITSAKFTDIYNKLPLNSIMFIVADLSSTNFGLTYGGATIIWIRDSKKLDTVIACYGTLPEMFHCTNILQETDWDWVLTSKSGLVGVVRSVDKATIEFPPTEKAVATAIQGLDDSKVDKPTDGWKVALTYSGSVSEGIEAAIPRNGRTYATLMFYGGSSAGTRYLNYFISGNTIIDMINCQVASSSSIVTVSSDNIIISPPGESGGGSYIVTM